MFRVSINFKSPQPLQAVDRQQASPEARARQGDWADEIDRVEKRLTEADLRATFSEKFSPSSETQLDKLA